MRRNWSSGCGTSPNQPISTTRSLLFKERLFVHLSRFCKVRYCITRHCAFLVGCGRGDPAAPAQTLEQVIRLLKTPSPWQRNSDAVFEGMEAVAKPVGWPEPESELEDWIFAAATLVFAEPGSAERARRALRNVLGGRRSEHLLGLLAFIRTAHYWTVLHPELELEDDVRRMLALNKELARLLMHDPDAERCEMGVQLFAELHSLRDLQARQELDKAKREMEIRDEQREILLREVNHRVKNSLQIVSSILRMQVRTADSKSAAEAMRGAAARVAAVAAVHERLYKGYDFRLVVLDSFLRELCQEVGRAYGCPEGIEIEAEPVEATTDLAVSLALIVNELVTNAIKYVGPPCRVELRKAGDGLTLSVSDSGQGPAHDARPGFGTGIVNALATQIGATLEPMRGTEGYSIELRVPSSSEPCAS